MIAEVNREYSLNNQDYAECSRPFHNAHLLGDKIGESGRHEVPKRRSHSNDYRKSERFRRPPQPGETDVRAISIGRH